MTRLRESETIQPSLPSNLAPRRWAGHLADDTGATDGPEPKVFLEATADELIISGSRGDYRIPRAAVTRIGRGKMYPWFFSAVRIHHSIPTYSKELQFRPLNAARTEVRRELRALGYPEA